MKHPEGKNQNHRAWLLIRLLSHMQWNTKRICWKEAQHLLTMGSMIERYVEEFSTHLRQGSGMVWQKGHGMTKSVLSLYLLYRLMTLGYQVHYEESFENFEYLTYDQASLEFHYPPCVQADLLILDHFKQGLKKLSPEGKLVLEKILLIRQKHNLPILFLTESDQSELENQLSNHLLNLLFSSKNKIVNFSDYTHRI